MSWTAEPGDSPAGEVHPAVQDEAVAVDPSPAVDAAPTGAAIDRASEGDAGEFVDAAETDAGSDVEIETDSDDVEAEGAAADEAAVEDIEPPREPDEMLLAAHDVALAGLREVTPDATIGAPAGYTLEEGGVVSLLFENRMPGYPGWFWTVSLARVDDGDPSVLELELLPGADALLAPEWVPWAVRLADYQAAQAALREAGEVDVEEEDDVDDDGLDLDDIDDLDAADFDRDGSPILHAGDVDGVDIDELAEATEDDVFDDGGEDSDLDDSDFVDDDDSDDDDSDDDDSDAADEDDSADVSDEDAVHGSRFDIEHDQN